MTETEIPKDAQRAPGKDPDDDFGVDVPQDKEVLSE